MPCPYEVRTMISVIIPAGGSSIRFGGENKKQFLRIGEETILNRSIQAFLDFPGVVEVVVCLPKDEMGREDLLAHELVKYVEGGATRSQSVSHGFKALNPTEDNHVVLIHDAARPLLTHDLIHRMVHATCEKGAAIPGTPVSDTIKEVDAEGRILRTVPRVDLRAVQTPQGFQYGLLKRAYETLPYEDESFTDESMLIEALGEPVVVVEGEKENIKITNRHDIEIAEILA